MSKRESYRRAEDMFIGGVVSSADKSQTLEAEPLTRRLKGRQLL